MLFSIIIPVYNVAPWLRRCLESVLSQIDGDAEVICVDDGSTDESGAILDELAARDGRLRVFHQENGGVSSARNRGLDMARGEWIAWVDSDDYVADDWYATLKGATSMGAEVIFFDLCRIEKGEKAVQVYGGPARFVDRDLYLSELYEDKKVRNYLWSRVFARRLFEGIRFSTGVSLMEDYLILHELVYRAQRLYYVPKVLYYYLIRADSLSHGPTTLVQYRAVEAARAYCSWLRERGISCTAEGRLKHEIFFYMMVLRVHEEDRWVEELSDIRRDIREHLFSILSFDIPMKEKVKYMIVGGHLDFLYRLFCLLKSRGVNYSHFCMGGASLGAVPSC